MGQVAPIPNLNSDRPVCISTACLYDMQTGHQSTSKLDLSSLPLGALRKAQHALAYAEAVSESDDNHSLAEDESEDDTRPVGLKEKQMEKPEWSLKPRKDLAKRANKHA